MSNIIHIIKPEYDFWEIYPEFKEIEEFKFIQKEYKTKSSLVMWFIVLAFDLDSKFANLPEIERTDLLSKDYFKDKDWYRKNSRLLQDAITMYEKLIDTPARRHLRQWKDTLEKRTVFLKSMDYDLDNYDKLDKMATNSAGLFKTLASIEEALSKEEGKGTIKGGGVMSIADEGDF